jgi:hypothetical protein
VQFLVKFEEESYRRARWVPLWAMRHREPHKLRGHWKRTGASETDPEAPLDRAAFEHVIPERVVDESDDLDAVLVKWCGLPYDECTWEPRGSFLEVSRDATATATEAARNLRARRRRRRAPPRTRRARASSPSEWRTTRTRTTASRVYSPRNSARIARGSRALRL